MAKKNDWKIVLRIEDLDSPRVKAGVIDETIDILRWLGIDWDTRPIIQSENLSPHLAAMESLARGSHVYPCELSRAEIQASTNAPNEGDREFRFDPSLRPTRIPSAFHDAGTNWRLIVQPGPIEFRDTFLGNRSIDPSITIGDFVVWTKRQCPSYQLAVVVDDHQQQITHVVRGNDLIDSTARQIALQRALGYDTTPTYTHLPLVRGNDGRRLAKRHGDTRVHYYRDSGTSPEHIIGLVGYWCGLTPSRSRMSIHEFLDGFRIDTLPQTDIVFTPEDDQWLT